MMNKLDSFSKKLGFAASITLVAAALLVVSSASMVAASPDNTIVFYDNTPILSWKPFLENTTSIDHYEVWLDNLNVDNVPTIAGGNLLADSYGFAGSSGVNPFTDEYENYYTPFRPIGTTSWGEVYYTIPMLQEGIHTWHVVAVEENGKRHKYGSEHTFELKKLSPDPFRLNHLGFLANESKRFLVKAPRADSFAIRDRENKIVYEGDLKETGSDLGKYKAGVFTDLSQSGTYRIEVEGELSRWFPIGDRARLNYIDALRKATQNYWTMQRCGDTYKNWIGHPCHLDDAVIAETGEHIDLTGGWHDADDVRKWINATLFGMYGSEAVKRNLNPAWDNGGILEELKWGNRYFLKAQQPEGYVIASGNWGGQSYWTNNIIGDADDREVSVKPAPLSRQYWFIGAEAGLYNLYKSVDPEYAQKCLWSSLFAYNYCKSHWPEGPSNYSSTSEAILAGIQLYKALKKPKFRDFAVRMTDRLLSLQVENYIENQTAIRGFFYSDNTRTDLYTGKNIWVPLAPISLCAMCDAFPNHENYPLWKESVRLYLENYIMPIADNNAYKIVPMNVYQNDLGSSRKIGGLSYRYFMDPTKDWWWVGNSSNVLGAAVYLAKASRILGNPKYRELAWRQIDWVLGSNPFNFSNMTGVGYNGSQYNFVGDTDPPVPLIDGAVMNGIGGYENDMPMVLPRSWHTGEYWSPHVGYVQWALSELLRFHRVEGRIIYENGTPASYVKVRLLNDNNEEVATDITNSDGFYNLNVREPEDRTLTIYIDNWNSGSGIEWTPGKIESISIANFPVKGLKDPWFVDEDNTVGLTDLMTVAYHYGEAPSSPNWLQAADVDESGSIGLSDLMTVAYHYGEAL